MWNAETEWLTQGSQLVNGRTELQTMVFKLQQVFSLHLFAYMCQAKQWLCQMILSLQNTPVWFYSTPRLPLTGARTDLSSLATVDRLLPPGEPVHPETWVNG